ncbi:hypothetical protein ACNHKD_16100 [Methylocystis sp. JAN1]|uniref:hypothetical protein n=1 Tax=Methylocystis sp. JAN1 TaxID=3397211 RepID=UPI003FA23910
MISISRRIALFALAAGLSFASFGAAEARDRSAKPAVRHAEDFYAYSNAPEMAAPAAPATESRGCFTTNSPVEATKGIRHWSGRC